MEKIAIKRLLPQVSCYRIISIICIFTALFLSGHVQSEVRIEILDKNCLVLENSYFWLEVNAERGARISRFRFKPGSNRDWIPNIADSGLMYEIPLEERYPGELQHKAWNFRILKKSDDLASVEFFTHMEKATPGVRVAKTLTIRKGSPTAEVTLSFSNPTNEKKMPAVWIQHFFFPDGKFESCRYYRPFPQGIQISTKDTHKSLSHIRGCNVTDGWSGFLNEETSVGMMFSFDREEINYTYNCFPAGCVAWCYDTVFLAPSCEWKTTYYFTPNKGFSGYVYGSKNFIAHAEFSPDGEGINLELASTREKLKNVKLILTVKSLKGNILQRSELEISELSFTPTRKSISLKCKEKRNIVLDVEAHSGTVTEQFDIYLEVNRIVTGYTAEEPIRELPRPRVKIFPSDRQITNLSQIRMLKHTKWNIFAFRGFYFDLYRLNKIFSTLPQLNIQYSYVSKVTTTPKVTMFFFGFDDIMTQDLIILGDVSLSPLQNECKIADEMLELYVKNGGSLLVWGGFYGLGKGKYSGSMLEKALPVNCQGPFELKPFKKGTPVRFSRSFIRTSDHGRPLCYWYHDVKSLKDGAQVWARAGGKPFLVTRTYGKGRVAVILGTVLGDPESGETPFWEWKEWHSVISQTMDWLLNK